MRVLTVDRFEGNFAICEDDEHKLYAIDQSEMPADAKEGDVIVINDEGEISIDSQETKRRRGKNKKIQDNLWK